MLRKFETEHTMHYERYKIKQFGDEVWLEYLISMEYNLTIDMHNMLHVNTLWVKENNSYLTTLRWMQNISINMNDLIIHYFLK